MDPSHSLLEGTRQDSSRSSDALPAGTISMAHQLLNPKARLSSRSKSRSWQSSPNPVETSSESHHPATSDVQSIGNVRFEFSDGDVMPEIEHTGIGKRVAAELESSHNNLIEGMYNIESRQSQPQKRLMVSKRDETGGTAGRKIDYRIPGNDGFGEWMREGRKSSETPIGVIPEIVDLTADPRNPDSNDEDDLQVTGFNDLSAQKVCYGKLQHAMIHAYMVPRSSSSDLFGGVLQDLPSMRLAIHRSPSDGNRISVADPQGHIFGAVDAKTAAVVVRLLDAPTFKFEITARLDVRRRSENEVPGQQCQASYPVSINIYGLRKDADLVGKYLGQNNIWLGSPNAVEQDVPLFNPHAERSLAQPSYMPSIASHDRMSVNCEVRTPEEVNDAVMKMFDQLKSADNIPEMEPSSLVLTPLLRHQKQALWFMTEKETARRFGPREEDNNSLWRVAYEANGMKRYREIISGTIVYEEPPQTLGGLLADTMGLGKTLSILSLVISTLPEAQKWQSMVPQPSLVSGSPGIRNTKTTLLVSPLSAVSNWVSQIKEHLKESAISYYVFHGSSRTMDVDTLSSYDFVITTYSIVLSELSGRGSKRGVSPLTKMNLFRIVLDEAHAIREQSTAQSQAIFKLNASRRWSVTGTPIQNRLDDLVSVTKFLRLFPYDDKSKFSAHILSKFKNGDANVLASLRVLVDSFTLRRVKDKINLPPRHDKIIMLIFSDKEKQIHEFFRNESKVLMNVIANDNKKTLGGRMYHHVLKALMILRQVSAHGKELLDKEDRERVKGMSIQDAIDLDDTDEGYRLDLGNKKAYEMFSLMQESSADVCAKCGKVLELDAFDGKAAMAVVLRCLDVLCIDCFSSWKQAFDTEPPSQEARCQVCDSLIPFTYSEITPAGLDDYCVNQAQSSNSRKHVKTLGVYGGPHTKTKALLSHLLETAEESKQLEGENQPPIKSVIFSAWTSHLDLIEIALKDSGLPNYSRLDGTMSLPAREKALEEFHTNNATTILLASIGAGGVGLNLTSASRVYVMEPQYNPAAVAQAIDRVHRLGQTREVTTVQFIMKDSIEEKIFELAMRKQRLADMSMNRGKLDRKEVQEARMQEYRSLFK